MLSGSLNKCQSSFLAKLWHNFFPNLHVSCDLSHVEVSDIRKNLQFLELILEKVNSWPLFIEYISYQHGFKRMLFSCMYLACIRSIWIKKYMNSLISKRLKYQLRQFYLIFLSKNKTIIVSESIFDSGKYSIMYKGQKFLFIHNRILTVLRNFKLSQFFELFLHKITLSHYFSPFYISFKPLVF